VNRPELPQGYSWQEVPGLRAVLPMPDGWYFKYEDAPGTIACFITRERILSDEGFSSPKVARQQVMEGQGFKTGLSVNSFADISKRIGISPVIFARSALTTNPLLISESRIEVFQDGPLFIHQGYFRSGSRLLASRGLPPIKYYIETVGNSLTNRAYILMFETPAELWERDKEIAEVIIKNRILDPGF